MCSSPKTNHAKSPTHPKFYNTSLKASHYADYAKVANAADERREEKRIREQDQNRSLLGNAESINEPDKGLRYWLCEFNLLKALKIQN